MRAIRRGHAFQSVKLDELQRPGLGRLNRGHIALEKHPLGLHHIYLRDHLLSEQHERHLDPDPDLRRSQHQHRRLRRGRLPGRLPRLLELDHLHSEQHRRAEKLDDQRRSSHQRPELTARFDQHHGHQLIDEHVPRCLCDDLLHIHRNRPLEPVNQHLDDLRQHGERRHLEPGVLEQQRRILLLHARLRSEYGPLELGDRHLF